MLPLDAAASHFPDLIGERLGTIVSGEGDPFVTINEAGWSGGALVYVPRNSRPVRTDLADRDPAGRPAAASTGAR